MMPPTASTDLDALRDDQLKRLLERYESSAKELRTFLGGLSVFAFGFLLLILVPYTSIQRQHQGIAKRLPQAAEQVRVQKSRADRYLGVQSGIRTLRKSIQSGPQKLREFVLKLPPSPTVEQQADQPAGLGNQQFAHSPMAQVAPNLPSEPANPCVGQAGEEWANCIVKQEVLRQFNEYNRVLRAEVLQPLKIIEPGAKSLINAGKLENELRALHTSLEGTLNATPRFWRTYQGKEGLFGGIEKKFEVFWNKYDAIIVAQSKEFEAQLAALEQEQDRLRNEEQKLEAQQEQLGNRLSTLASPFGKLPVGLNESVLVFPVLLAVGFLILMGRFCDTLRLRSVLRALAQEIDPQGTVWNDSSVALIVPLWFDPLDAVQNQSVRWIGLLAPVVAFIAATAMSWSISTTFLTEDPFSQRLYGTLYVLTGVALVFGCWRVARMVRSNASPG